MTEEQAKSPLPNPKNTQDPNWAQKVEKAKQAREAGKQVRLGKSPVFRTH